MFIQKGTSKAYFARKLRLNQTKAEELLWDSLRNRKFMGIKFRRQQTIGKYIVDFVSFERKVIVELDGAHHKNLDTARTDILRTEYLRDNGFSVVRFWNNQVLDSKDDALGAIRNALSSPQPSPKRRGRPRNILLSPSTKWRGGEGGEV